MFYLWCSIDFNVFVIIVYNCIIINYFSLILVEGYFSHFVFHEITAIPVSSKTLGLKFDGRHGGLGFKH